MLVESLHDYRAGSKARAGEVSSDGVEFRTTRHRDQRSLKIVVPFLLAVFKRIKRVPQLDAEVGDAAEEREMEKKILARIERIAEIL